MAITPNITFRLSNPTAPSSTTYKDLAGGLLNSEVDGNFKSLRDAIAGLSVGTNATGTWGISITGNAATVTNGVYTSTTYTDPSWLTITPAKVLPSFTGNDGKFLTTNGSIVSWASLPSGQTAGSVISGYLAYAGTTKTTGQLYGGTTTPDATTRLNYNGHFYATKFFGDASGMSNIPQGQAGDSTSTGFVTFGGSTKATGTFYSGTTSPTNTTRLNYDGNLFVNAFTAVGAVSAGSVSSSGAISGTSITGSGTVSGATVTSSGNVTGVNITGSGTVSGATVTSSGNVTGVNMTASGTITGVTINSTSDARVKENIAPIYDALNKVKGIRGYTFTFKSDVKRTRHAGVIAQEVLNYLPEVVSGSHEDGYTVAYGNMVALLIEAVKELSTEVEQLRAKVGQ